MNFEFSSLSLRVQQQVQRFMDERIVPRIPDWQSSVDRGIFPPPFIEELKAQARSQGLWNLFLPGLHAEEPGTALNNLDYAPVAEIMGRVPWASEVFNCSAPDTGNMELLHGFATPAQRNSWLLPLLHGEIRSAFAMTEPEVASSDATNIATTIVRVGDDLLINGRKWFITNSADPRCKLIVVMGVSELGTSSHERHSMALVPMDTEGLKVVRNIPVMHHLAPEGHGELIFKNVRVPANNLLGRAGQGFAMAQARLGPGRIHHCMRSIGQCELAFELMCRRALTRRTFGKALAERDSIASWIAQSRLQIEQARLLVLKTAWMIDQFGAEAARTEISMIKALVPRMQVTIVDRAIQVFGAAGLTPDTPLAFLWTWGRALCFADGPDEIHLRAVARRELQKFATPSTVAARYAPDRVAADADLTNDTADGD